MQEAAWPGKGQGVWVKSLGLSTEFASWQLSDLGKVCFSLLTVGNGSCPPPNAVQIKENARDRRNLETAEVVDKYYNDYQ